MSHDEYAKQAAYLREHPEKILKHWLDAIGLFRRSGEWPCGCLTQVRNKHRVAQTRKLTKRILADERIPRSPFNITPDSFDAFAEWNRIIDAELGREPFTFTPPEEP